MKACLPSDENSTRLGLLRGSMIVIVSRQIKSEAKEKESRDQDKARE
jgi:hypothetical protein